MFGISRQTAWCRLPCVATSQNISTKQDFIYQKKSLQIKSTFRSTVSAWNITSDSLVPLYLATSQNISTAQDLIYQKIFSEKLKPLSASAWNITSDSLEPLTVG